MEEVIDRAQAARSPKELAIHFLLRHAECRKALTGLTVEDSLQEALAHCRPEAPCKQPEMAGSARSEESLSGGDSLPAGVTEDDSCAARFSRAHAAARHNLARASVPPTTGSAESDVPRLRGNLQK